MPRLVDCRRCVFFKSWSELSYIEKRQAEEWVDKYRPGENPQGYCLQYNRPVTYLVGSCRGFRRKPGPEPRSILEYVKRGEVT